MEHTEAKPVNENPARCQKEPVMVIMSHYLYSHLKDLCRYFLVLLTLLLVVRPQWSSAEESVDCTAPTASCYKSQDDKSKLIISNQILGHVSALKKAEKSPIPVATVIVDTPKK